MARKFAEKTKVDVAQTIGDVQALLGRYGGSRFQHIPPIAGLKAVFQFDYADFAISFGFPVPPVNSNEQERRRIYRAVHLCIKAKLEAVASGIESPAHAFFAHIVKNGRTMFDEAKDLLPVPAWHVNGDGEVTTQ